MKNIQGNPSNLNELQNKFEIYKDLSSRRRDPWGWNTDDKCDGLLFNCLWSLCGIDVDIMKAQDKKGKWHRHPAMNCYESNESGSEISRDMLIGLVLWIIAGKRTIVLNDLIDYGESHSWVMGKGDISRTFVSCSLRSTLYAARYNLTGKDSFIRKIPRDWEKPFPLSFATSQKGYSRHLQMLHILALSFLRSPSDRDREVVEYHCKKQPRNALYHAINYRLFDKSALELALGVLLDDSLFPSSSLPTSENYKTSYLFQRDQEEIEAWKPSLDGKTHSAIEWLFSTAIILGIL